MGSWALARPVWHCSVRAAPGDKMLSDDEWAQIAWDVMHRTGLAPYGQEDDAVRWVAVRHGDDHVHIVAMLARQDGRRPRLHNDRYRVREACLAAEQRYGLRATAPGDRTAPRRPSRAETEKAARRGLDEAPRVTLRRQVTTAAAAAAQRAGVLRPPGGGGVLVRTRQQRQRTQARSPGTPSRCPATPAGTAAPVWYGGGKLAADLTWPKLCQRWTGPGTRPADPLTAAERSAVWDHAARVADRRHRADPELAGTDPAAAADAAWATSDTLHAAAAALGSRILRQAADAYDRGSPRPLRPHPRAHPGREQLRQAARLLSAYGYLTSDPSLRPIVLITRLAALAEAVAALRQTQDPRLRLLAHSAPISGSMPPNEISPRLALGIGLPS